MQENTMLAVLPSTFNQSFQGYKTGMLILAKRKSGH